jgi:hypothetical protein
MAKEGLGGVGHGISDVTCSRSARVQVTPADHAWQNEIPGKSEHFHLPEDACGFWIETPDGTSGRPATRG